MLFSDPRPLSAAQIHDFIHRGYVRLDRAFDRSLAAAARDILWRDITADRYDPSTWTELALHCKLRPNSHFSPPALCALLAVPTS